jgi:predicted membrane-bound spermidine synthase
MTKKILIVSVFVVASCGLAYELIAGALSSYLLGLGASVFNHHWLLPVRDGRGRALLEVREG